MLIKIGRIEKNTEKYLNNDNYYGLFPIDVNNPFEIHVDKGRGQKPFFYILKKNGEVIRVKLLKNEYLRDGNNRFNSLDSQDRLIPDKFFKSNFGNRCKITCWQYICSMWNMYNPDSEIDYRMNQITQPLTNQRRNN